ncbi:hypothetical protein KKA15_06545 [Patescibacteria group bacterium]|nr:hypothetical protein [Patescibacteria group bacterium]
MKLLFGITQNSECLKNYEKIALLIILLIFLPVPIIFLVMIGWAPPFFGIVMAIMSIISAGSIGTILLFLGIIHLIIYIFVFSYIIKLIGRISSSKRWIVMILLVAISGLLIILSSQPMYSFGDIGGGGDSYSYFSIIKEQQEYDTRQKRTAGELCEPHEIRSKYTRCYAQYLEPVIKNEDISLCDQENMLSNIVYNCYIDYGIEFKDITVCEKIPKDANDDREQIKNSQERCYEEIFPISYEDISICEEIPDLNRQLECKKHAMRSSVGSTTCTNIIDISLKDKCYYDYAIYKETGHMFNCREIVDTTLRDKCNHDFVVNKDVRSHNACSDITETILRDQCYTVVVGRIFGEDECGGQSNDETIIHWQNICYYLKAQKFNDSTYCSMVREEVLRNECQNSL